MNDEQRAAVVADLKLVDEMLAKYFGPLHPIRLLLKEQIERYL